MADKIPGGWTEAQSRAITTTGRSILVSAAAGSGKTSVLAERCAYLVCDAPPPHRAEITELLVVTFTEAAAAEMRARIARALLARYEKKHDAHLARQLALIDRASISTIHGFCARVLRQHFHVLGIDPNFTMLSEEEGRLMRAEIVRELFADRYETDEDGSFGRFVDRYGDGRDEALRDRVIHTHALLGSLVDPADWTQRARTRIREAAEKPMNQSALGRPVLKRIQFELNALHERMLMLIQRINAARLDGYIDFAGELLATVSAWHESFASGGIDALAACVQGYQQQKRPSLRNLTPEQEALKAELAVVQSALKDGDIYDLCRFSENEWREGMAAVIEPTGLLLDLVGEFGARYEKQKHELRVLDFSDLERLALKVLAQPAAAGKLAPSAAAIGYRDQFKHVLVDEYQDVNELQDAILSLVCRGDLNSENLFCVGDVKQSIYRFRLADPEQFLKRDRNYSKDAHLGTAIYLQTNFRSRALLLSTLNEMFSRLMTKAAAELDYVEQHFLHAPPNSPYSQFPQAGAQLELHLLRKQPRGESDESPDKRAEDDELDQTEREASIVARRINELMRDFRVLEKDPAGGFQQRPVRFGDIAILLRSMRFKSERFSDILRGNGIPVHSDTGGGFFASTEVQDVLALLHVLDNPRQDIPLAALLRSPIAAIARAEDALARIRLAYASKGATGELIPFHVAVMRYAREQTDELAARLRDILNELTDWRERAAQRPLAEVLWQIYDQTGYLAFCEGLDDGEQRVANLIALHERARQFDTFRRQGLSRFMRFLDQLRDEVDDVGQPSVASEAEDTVRIMSVHRSKGLEFPIVFVPDLGKKHNLSDSRGHILVDKQAGMGLEVCDEVRRIRYPSLASTIVSERLRKQSLAEEMRVLYVAATRAKEKLILTGACAADANEKWSSRWSGHDGPLPADEVLGGGCMLDWIGPAVAAIESSGTPGADATSIEVFSHDGAPPEAVASWKKPQLSAAQLKLAQLSELDAKIPADAAERADSIWQRLTRPYRYETLGKIPATIAVTALSQHELTQFEPGGTPRRIDGDRLPGAAQTLRRPRFSLDAFTPMPEEIGEATHALLQHLDFTRPCTKQDLDEQLDALIHKKLIHEKFTPFLDLAGVSWLACESALAGKLRAATKAGTLLREMPINFAVHPKVRDEQAIADFPADNIMVRGRIDAMIVEPDLRSPTSIDLIDFKTDNVRPGTPMFAERVEIYQKQLNEYSGAIRALLKQPVVTSLVFLRARSIVSSPLTS